MPPISRTTIQQALQANGWNQEPDSDGDYVLRFKPDEDHGCRDLVMISIEGDEDDVFAVRLNIDRDFPIDEWKRILMLVNDFNRDYRWPNAFVRFPESEDDTTVTVACGYFVKCAGPVTQDMLSNWIIATMAGADRLFTMLIVDNKIPLR